jgi:hypothetical protein
VSDDEKKTIDPTDQPLRWSPPRRPAPKKVAEAPLQVFEREERGEYVAPIVRVVPRRARQDVTKLKVRREEREVRSFATGLGAYSKPGKTARDRVKPPSGQKTNDPSISQKMRGAKGQKSSK